MSQPLATTDSPKPAGLSPVWISVILAVVVLAFYGVSVRWGLMNIDDPEYVPNNEFVRSGLSAENIKWALTGVRLHNWHPLTWMSLQLDATLYGTWYGGFHLTSVLLHACSTVMIFWLFFLSTGAKWRSAMVALLFAIHPTHLESVVWITERKDTLCGVLGLLSLLAYVSYAKKGGAWRLALVTFLLAMGLLAKSMLVTWPCVMLLMDIWPLRRVRWPGAAGEPVDLPMFRRASPGALILEKLPMFAIVATVSVAMIFLQRGATSSTEQVGLGYRAVNFFIAIARYLGHTFAPTDIAIFYPLKSWPPVVFVGALALFIGISVWAWMQRRSRPYLAVGWLWFVGTLVPVVGIVQVGMQSLANRYVYLPHIGLFVAVVWCVADLPVLRRSARAAAAVAVVVIALLSIQFFRLLPFWSDPVSLWAHTLQHTDDNYTARFALGSAYMLENRHDLAAPQFQAVIQFKPNHLEALTNLGMALIALKRPNEAIAPLLAARNIKPDHYPACANLASALAESGRHQEAAAEFREVLRMAPTETKVWLKLADELAATGDLKGAEEQLRALLASAPAPGNAAAAHNALGIVCARLGDLPGAVEQFSAALRLDPNMTDARDNLARAQSMLKAK